MTKFEEAIISFVSTLRGLFKMREGVMCITVGPGAGGGAVEYVELSN